MPPNGVSALARAGSVWIEIGIEGELGERIDLLLIEDRPIGNSDLLADHALKLTGSILRLRVL